MQGYKKVYIKVNVNVDFDMTGYLPLLTII